MASTAERLAALCIPEPNSGCWLWEGTLAYTGYGQFHYKRRTAPAHRASYELVCGPVPKGLFLDHLCRNRACVNPDHLEAVTPSENAIRGDTGKHHAIKTHCPQGHPYSGRNLYVPPAGGRYCRACISMRTRRWQKNRRAG